MADYKAEIIIKARENASQAFRKVAEATNRVRRAQDEYRTTLRRLKGESDRTSEAIGKLRNAVIALAAAFSVKRFVGSIIEAGERMENWRNSLIALTGSVDVAQRKLKELIKFARTTPFETPWVIDAAQRLEALGLNSTRYMKVIGDAAAAMTTTVSEATTAFIAGIVGETEVLRRFGVQASLQGQQMTFRWRDRLGEMHEITVQRSNEIIAETLKMIWNSKYAGSMRKYMLSWKGIWLTLSSMWFEWKARIAQAGFFKFLEDKFRKLFDRVNELQERGKLDEWAKKISDALVKMTDTAIRAASSLYRIADKMGLLSTTTLKVTGALIGLTAGIKTLQFLFNVIGGGVIKVYALGRAFESLTGLGGVLGVVQSLSKEFGVLRAATVSLGAALGTVVSVGASAFAGWEIGKLISKLKIAGRSIGEWVQVAYTYFWQMGENIRHVFSLVFIVIRQKWGQVMMEIQRRFYKFIQGAGNALSKVPGFKKVGYSLVEYAESGLEGIEERQGVINELLAEENKRHQEAIEKIRWVRDLTLGRLKQEEEILKVKKQQAETGSEGGSGGEGTVAPTAIKPVDYSVFEKEIGYEKSLIEQSLGQWKAYYQTREMELENMFNLGKIRAEEYYGRLAGLRMQDIEEEGRALSEKLDLLEKWYSEKKRLIESDVSLKPEARASQLKQLEIEYNRRRMIMETQEKQLAERKSQIWIEMEGKLTQEIYQENLKRYRIVFDMIQGVKDLFGQLTQSWVHAWVSGDREARESFKRIKKNFGKMLEEMALNKAFQAISDAFSDYVIGGIKEGLKKAAEKEAIAKLIEKIGDKLADKISGGVVDGVEEGLASAGVGKAVGKAIAGVGVAGAISTPMLAEQAAGAGAAAAGGAGAALSAALPYLAIAAAVIAGIYILIKYGDKIVEGFKQFFSSLWDGIMDLMSGLGNIISEIMTGIGNFVSTFWNTTKQMMSSLLKGIEKVVEGIWNLMGQVWNGIKQGAQALFDSLKNAAKWVWDFIKSIPGKIWGGIKHIFGFQEGGVVMRPVLGVVGEAGPEAVIPLRKLPGIIGEKDGEEYWEKEYWGNLFSALGRIYEILGYIVNILISEQGILKSIQSVINGLDKAFMYCKANPISIGVPFLFQEGGVVRKPVMGVVGEAGPEAVIPLRKLPNILDVRPSLQASVRVDVHVHEATPNTWVEVFTQMPRGAKEAITKELRVKEL